MSFPISRRILGPWLKRRVVSIRGLEHIPSNGPIIFVSNHVGEHDPLLLGATIILHTGGRKIHAVAKWKILRLQPWRKWLGCVPLYQDRSRTFALLTKLIAEKKMVLIYSEGRINNSPVILKAKTGAARLALATRAPIIPVGLKRTSPPPRSEIEYLLEILYATLHIQFGKPIDLSPWYGKNIDATVLREANERIMATVATLADKKYSPQDQHE